MATNQGRDLQRQNGGGGGGGQLTPAQKQKAELQGISADLEQIKGQLIRALPKHLNVERFLRLSLTAFQQTPQLFECTRASVYGAIVQASQMGLEVNNGLGEAYLVPFKDHGVSKCQLIPGYRGFVKLARNTGQVGQVYARVRYMNDFFEITQGTSEEILHKPGLLEEDQVNDASCILGAYAVAHLLAGRGRATFPQFEVMQISQILAIKARSKSAGSSYSPWNTDFAEMCKKTAMRRLAKWIPLSANMARAIQLDDEADQGITQDFGDLIDTEAVDPKQQAAVPANAPVGRRMNLGGDGGNDQPQTGAAAAGDEQPAADPTRTTDAAAGTPAHAAAAAPSGPHATLEARLAKHGVSLKRALAILDAPAEVVDEVLAGAAIHPDDLGIIEARLRAVEGGAPVAESFPSIGDEAPAPAAVGSSQQKPAQQGLSLGTPRAKK